MHDADTNPRPQCRQLPPVRGGLDPTPSGDLTVGVGTVGTPVCLRERLRAQIPTLRAPRSCSELLAGPVLVADTSEKKLSAPLGNLARLAGERPHGLVVARLPWRLGELTVREMARRDIDEVA